MSLIDKLKNALRGCKQRWGSPQMKRCLWNEEFSNGRWGFIENTSGDIIYPIIEKYSRNGAILDLGCGSGNTGCELNPDKYSHYTGVDISDVAIEKAMKRSMANHRNNKNSYFQSDITTYTPSQKYDVILFRESIYYIPRLKIKPTLGRYANFLKREGIFVIRCHDQHQGSSIIDLLSEDYILKEQIAPVPAGPLVAIFYPKEMKPT
jgi:SAM-dependent methyltransferase